MKLLGVALLALASCSVATPKPTLKLSDFELPKEFRHCYEEDKTPRALPPVRTPKQIAMYANRLELSREALIRQRDMCNVKREAVVRMYDRLFKETIK